MNGFTSCNLFCSFASVCSILLSSAVASSLLSSLATTYSVLFPVFVIVPVSCCPHAVNEHTIITEIIKNNLFFISFFPAILHYYSFQDDIFSLAANCISIFCNERLHSTIIRCIYIQYSIVCITLMFKRAFKYKKEYPHIYLIVI